MNIDRTIQLAHQLADASGAIIRSYFRQSHLETETKLDQASSIVTIADQEAEEAMVAIIQRELPEDGIIREEGANIPSQSGRYWVLDPIDGTSSFVKGLPIFGTLIGLVSEKKTILGIVDQPILGDRWLGVKGQPSRYNNQIIHNPYIQEENSVLENACLASTTPLMFITERQQAIARNLQKICKRTAFGGDCYNYMMLATGWSAMPMIILESDMKYYDFCALIPIIEGVGAIITDWSGNPLQADSSDVLAVSNRRLWQKVLEKIKADR
jgi:inositol-phosphate phosphatase / L-galactose 1-phosphate phosphatase / histidinol-phosphatase